MKTIMRKLNQTGHTGVGRYPAFSLKGLLAIPVLRTNVLTHWIPAFAGMTKILNLARFLLAAFLLSTLTAQAAETRALKIIATDRVTNQTGEVALYRKTFAVIIGIDEYSDKKISPLKNAVKDAKGIADVLKRQYKFDEIITRFNKEATRESIMDLLTYELPKRMNEDDALFIFWAGHGNQKELNGNVTGYLITSDGDSEKIASNITMSDIRETISNQIPAKHIFYVMDACYSGLLTETRSIDKGSRRDLAYLQE